MIGVFDSGRGGEVALCELRRLAPRADLAFFADRKNAPYGTKSEEELVPLVERDVRILREAGCGEILIACCTASTAYPRLNPALCHGVHPIITPTARAAASATKTDGIAVIGTERTVASRAFTKEILSLMPGATVIEFPMQALVGIIEGGACDGRCTEADLFKIRTQLSCLKKEIENENLDTLVLGCTHFPLLKGIIGEHLSGIRLISSAHEGAREILKHSDTTGVGRTVYL